MLKKDLLELCLLQLLAGEEQYGYELLHRLHAAFPDTQESAIYAILRNLCKAGATQSYEGAVSGGPARKYYRLTEEGRERLAGLRTEWLRLRDTITALGVE